MEKFKLDAIESKYIIPSKKSTKTIENFLPKTITLDEENSTIKANQCGVISQIGLVYIYTSSSLFIFNNKNLETLIQDNSTDINANSLCSITFNSQILQIVHNNTHIFILCRNSSFISVISIKDILTQKEAKIESSITFNKQIKKFLIIENNNDIVVLTNDNNLIYKNKSDLKEKVILSECTDFDIGKILTAFDTKSVYIISLNDLNIKQTLLISNIQEDSDEQFNTISMIKNYIVITTIKDIQDNVYFIKIDPIKYNPIKIYYENDFYYIEEDFMNKCKNKRVVFPHYIPLLHVLFIVDKQYDKIEKLFLIEENDIKEITLEDDNQPNTILKNYEQNVYIGFNVIDFKFKTYDSNDTMIDSIKYPSPLLCVNVGFQGGIRVFYLKNETQNDTKCILNKVQSNLFENQILNKHISIHIKPPSNTNKEKNMSSKSSDKQQSSPTNNSKLNEHESTTKKLIKERQNVQLNTTRNQTLKNIKINLLLQAHSIKKSTLISSIDNQIKNVEMKLNTFNKCNSLLIDLSSQATKYFNDKPTIYKTIQQQKQNINEQKISLHNLNINYKEAEKTIKQISNFHISDNVSLIQVLSSNEVRSFFGDSQCNKLITLVQDVNKYSHLIQEQQNIYEIIIKIFTTFYKEVANIKKECDNYIKYQKMFAKVSNHKNNLTSNQLSKKDFEAKMQNDILNKYLNVFRLLYNELKNLYDNCLYALIQEHKEKINESNVSDVTYNEVAIANKKIAQYNNNTNNMMQIKQRTKESKVNSFEVLKEMIMNRNCVVTYADSSECFDVSCLMKEEKDEEVEVEVEVDVNKYDDNKFEMIKKRVEELKLEKERNDKKQRERKENEEEMRKMKKKVDDMYRLNIENIKKYEELAKRAQEIKEEEIKLENIKKRNEEMKNEILKKEMEVKLQQKNEENNLLSNNTNKQDNEKQIDEIKETNTITISNKETNEQKDKDKDKENETNNINNKNNNNNIQGESNLFKVHNTNNNNNSIQEGTSILNNELQNLTFKTTNSGGLFGNVNDKVDNKTNTTNIKQLNITNNNNSNENNKEPKQEEPKTETQNLQNSTFTFKPSSIQNSTSSLFSSSILGNLPTKKENTPLTSNNKPTEPKPKEEPKPFLTQSIPFQQPAQNPFFSSQHIFNNQQQQIKTTNTNTNTNPNPNTSINTSSNPFLISSSLKSAFTTSSTQQNQPNNPKPQSNLFNISNPIFTQQQLPQQPQSSFGQHGFTSSTNNNPNINKNIYNLSSFGNSNKNLFASFGTSTQNKSSFTSFSTGTTDFFGQKPTTQTDDKSKDYFSSK